MASSISQEPYLTLQSKLEALQHENRSLSMTNTNLKLDIRQTLQKVAAKDKQCNDDKVINGFYSAAILDYKKLVHSKEYQIGVLRLELQAEKQRKCEVEAKLVELKQGLKELVPPPGLVLGTTAPGSSVLAVKAFSAKWPRKFDEGKKDRREMKDELRVLTGNVRKLRSIVRKRRSVKVV